VRECAAGDGRARPRERSVQSFAKMLIVLGLALAACGVWLLVGPKTSALGWLGRLPGDIRIEKPNFRFYFPLTTGILLSIGITLLLRLFGKK
jgi:ABC-type Na+ efflux pump permease subunit